MKFRAARHTLSLQVMIDFYTQNLALEVLGEFKDHNGYDGVFIGKKGAAWHLEFTVSPAPPVHHFDEDDLLVFYAENESEFTQITHNFALNHILPLPPKNPYWANNAVTYADPDGHRIVVALTPY